MKSVAIILSSLTALITFILIGAIACNRAPGSGPFPVQGWMAIVATGLAVLALVAVVIALRR